jgi:hypothetical protein
MKMMFFALFDLKPVEVYVLSCLTILPIVVCIIGGLFFGKGKKKSYLDSLPKSGGSGPVTSPS